jgi:hypothetical protein
MYRFVRVMLVFLLLCSAIVSTVAADVTPRQGNGGSGDATNGVTIDDTVHGVEQAPLSAVLPPKPASDSPWAKVSSQLSQTSEKLTALAADGMLAGAASLSTPLVRVDGSGSIQVDAWLDDTSAEAIAALEARGLKIERSNLSANVVEGWLDYQHILDVAALPALRLLTLPSYPDVDTGTVNSQGDAIHRANLVRSTLGINGAGQKVCAMSDGVTSRASSQASGNLPASIDVRKVGDGDEGTAMLEIIHDLTPGAALGFYGPDTAVDMANGIRILRNAGCTVIIDDLSFNGEPYYQDGQINAAITDVMVNSNVSYAGSAGNVAQMHWQGTYVAGTFSGGRGTANRWLGTDELFGLVLQNNGYFGAYLQWNDPWGGSGNDYDLYLYNGSGQLLAGSQDTQAGAGNPIEYFFYQNTTGGTQTVYLAAFRWQGATNNKLQVYTRGGGVTAREYNVVQGSVTPNHHTLGMFTSAAIDAADPGNDTIESFSSQGPVEHFFPSYEVRNKPDITGIDGVSVTGAGGFSSPFFGTSAAAPHIAAIAALVRSAHPGATRDEVYWWMAGGAIDLGAPGQDTTFGFGRADALNAVYNAMGGTPTRTATVTRTPTRTATRTSTPTPTATPRPILSTDPATLGILVCGSQQPVPGKLWVVNTSTVPLNWSATESTLWLTISPTTGIAVAGAPGLINLYVNMSGLTPGIRNSTVTVSSSTAGVLGSPRNVPVQLSIQTTCRRVFLPVIVAAYPTP